METHPVKRKIVAVLATTLMSALSVGAAATPAAADCGADRFCLYQTAGYAGTEYSYAPGSACTNLGSGINNDANAMRNYRNHAVMLWDLPGCGGSSTYRANAFSYDSDFGNNGFSNKASSLKRI
ncbi:peptidase inhibitor family I36 protein [Micromonospora rifamycinica]|uniref:peptidase inhibitor family I36 protein n=1 Tax=Micromonospora rifamycinica TaxID=291594 RepID=UPI002E29A2C3|nr:peptidase inhibitor family I36 protein [Micromonospora rifamycinica]